MLGARPRPSSGLIIDKAAAENAAAEEAAHIREIQARESARLKG
jgi:hypothetical protein